MAEKKPVYGIWIKPVFTDETEKVYSTNVGVFKTGRNDWSFVTNQRLQKLIRKNPNLVGQKIGEAYVIIHKNTNTIEIVNFYPLGFSELSNLKMTSSRH